MYLYMRNFWHDWVKGLICFYHASMRKHMQCKLNLLSPSSHGARGMQRLVCWISPKQPSLVTQQHTETTHNGVVTSIGQHWAGVVRGAQTGPVVEGGCGWGERRRSDHSAVLSLVMSAAETPTHCAPRQAQSCWWWWCHSGPTHLKPRPLKSSHTRSPRWRQSTRPWTRPRRARGDTDGSMRASSVGGHRGVRCSN